MGHDLINPADSLERQNEKLLKITETLMRRVEQNFDTSGAAYTQFQRAVMLEEEVRTRTSELERALDLLNTSNSKLALANAETEAARANLANAIETIQEGFALFNPQDEMVMCNTRFGKHMLDIYSLFKPGMTFEEYVHLVSVSPFLSLSEGETPESWAAYRMSRHKDNHAVFNVQMAGSRWLQVSEHRTPDRGTVILQTDITDMMRLERRERERLLDDQAHLIKATLEHLNQGICIFDEKGRLVGWNRRTGELLALEANKLQLGTYFATLYDQIRNDLRFHDEDDPNMVEQWVASNSKRAPLSFELGLGNDRTLAVFAQQMPDRGFVMSFTDVTAERTAVRAISQVNETLEKRVAERTLELEDALSEAERANASKSRFVAAASHDLLQPLSAAKLYVASLETELDTPDLIDRAQKAGNALVSVEGILSALLDISKLDSGQAFVDISSFSLKDILTQLHDELQPLAVQKGLEFNLVFSGAVVQSDASFLRRILQNLASNAVRYTETGKVLIGVRNQKKSVRIEVWDTGPGIPEDQQGKVFDEFHRLDTFASPAEGMGLGLAIVDRACRLLNYPLHLNSTVDRGTCFAIEVPRAASSETWTAPAPIGQSGSDVCMEHKIAVLIENDADLRSALTITLEGWGLDVLPCASLAEAQDLLTAIDIAPDVIVADYQLDDQALGTTAIADLRGRYGNIPSCIVTANRSPDLVGQCEKEATKLIYKPIDPIRLRGFLEQVLHG